MTKGAFFSLFKNSQGSLMIEVAITLPVLVLLLFGAMDITRFIHAVHKSDIAVDAIANALRDHTKITDEDAINLLLVAKNNMSFKEYSPMLELIIDGIRVLPDGTIEKLWTINKTVSPTGCNTPSWGAMPVNSNANGYAPYQYLLSFKLCSNFEDDFFLTSIVPADIWRISSSTVRHANYLFQAPSGQL